MPIRNRYHRYIGTRTVGSQGRTVRSLSVQGSSTVLAICHAAQDNLGIRCGWLRRQQYDASDRFGRLGIIRVSDAESFSCRFRRQQYGASDGVVGVLARRVIGIVSQAQRRKVLSTGQVAVQCKRQGRSRELCSIWQVNLGSEALPSRVQVVGLLARQVIGFAGHIGARLVNSQAYLYEACRFVGVSARGLSGRGRRRIGTRLVRFVGQ